MPLSPIYRSSTLRSWVERKRGKHRKSREVMKKAGKDMAGNGGKGLERRGKEIGD